MRRGQTVQWIHLRNSCCWRHASAIIYPLATPMTQRRGASSSCVNLLSPKKTLRYQSAIKMSWITNRNFKNIDKNQRSIYGNLISIYNFFKKIGRIKERLSADSIQIDSIRNLCSNLKISQKNRWNMKHLRDQLFNSGNRVFSLFYDTQII